MYQWKVFQLPGSISETYYYQSCNATFMIILGSASILLICYNGYDKQDAIVCTLAGIFGLAICLFPCWFNGVYKVGILFLKQSISNKIHNISAIVFFILLAYNSLFLFTKTTGEMTPEKKKRNIIFRVCGIGMVASFLLLIPLSKVDCGIWIVEAIALSFFGVSWLTKSQCYSWLFKDKK